jgi:hypothetical protein
VIVPPATGLVVRFFGTARMATQFGIVVLWHQIGGFLGAWLRGKAFEWTSRHRLAPQCSIHGGLAP